MSRKRNIQKHLFLSDEENKVLQKNAAECGTSESDYIRMLIMGVEPKAKASEEINKFNVELGYLLGNINQLLKKANKIGFVDAPMLESERDKWKRFREEFEDNFFNHT